MAVLCAGLYPNVIQYQSKKLPKMLNIIPDRQEEFSCMHVPSIIPTYLMKVHGWFIVK